MTAPDLVHEVPAEARPITLISDPEPRHAGGRPLKLDLERFLRICSWIQQGKTNTDACRIENVAYSHFRFRTRIKPSWKRRYELANKMRDDFMRDFHVENIMRHAPKAVLASLWWMERRFPNEFALRRVDRDDHTAERPQYQALTREQLLESIRRSKELEAEAPIGWQPALPETSSDNPPIAS